ncbi:hypothetical protein FKN01_09465 [Streptomyces sp. 130]|uniref:restriction endonuclease subunit S n=1 Tax=Streptomyces sp. 130 TaxID=2591006 RepID=UPI001180DF0C|nr:restriction endonuclease subunit S [Streptomyces sp. 130]TRV79385.1 hypothetical protein FKN01_09465 [Streptomyces sp. 130]
MSAYPVVPLSDLVTEAKPGFACGEEDPDGVFQLRMNNVTRTGEIDLSRKRYVPRDHAALPSSTLSAGDVLFNATNSPDLVGKTLHFPGLEEPVAFSNHFIRLRVESERLEPRFLARWLQSRFEAGHFKSMCRQWVNQATVGREALLGLKVAVPPIAAQKRIVQVLDQVDALRAKRRKAVALLDSLAHSIFLDVFHADLPGCRQMELPEAFWFQEGPGIRKWQFVESGVKLLNVGNIEKNGELNLGKTHRYISAEEAHGRYSHFLVDAGDLVIASSGISIDDDGLLRTRGSFVDGALLPLCMNTSTIRFKSIPGVSDLYYLRSWLNGVEFRSQITRRVTGSAQLNFGPSHLKELKISLPPIAVQEEFAEKVKKIDSMKLLHQNHLAELDALFASLRQRAFRGEPWSQATVPAT